MHHALCISEILSQIFYYIKHDRKWDLASCVMVCRAWFVPSVEGLWEEIVDPMPIVRILGEVHKVENGEHWVR